MKRFLLSVFAAALSAAALAQPATPPSRETAPFPDTVSVTGVGRATVLPDRFSFNASVQTMAPTVEEAVNENNSKVAAVIAALKNAGAAADEIKTSNFSIYPQQDYSQQQQGKPPRVVGYQVSNSITVTKKQIADAGRLLQAAIAAGVNQTSGLSFTVSDPTRGRDEGMRAAFADAHAKASLLAQAAGRTLGPAMTITESGSSPPTPRPLGSPRAMAAVVAEPVPVESGTQDLSFTVSVVFALR
ncbi:MAG TPA: SIMPL domain-containing protein [Thermoanaerobaculia bacterium]|nr:SIMPL domain-containing protein [Thermoanaerobaculia bacterium]